MAYQLLHNPRCSKSRQAKQLLDERGVQYEVIEYLKTPLGADELRDLSKKLKMSPKEMLRKKEAAFKEKNLGDASATDEDAIKAMAEEPVLLERPILVKGKKAVIGRPTENLESLL